MGEEILAFYPNTSTIPAGQVVQLTAIPNPGYVFTKWDGNSVETTATISITMTCTKSLTAIFTPIKYSLSTSISQPATGAITLDPPQPPEGYLSGARVSLRATPAKGYIFKEWSGNTTSTEAVASVIMDAGKTVTAVFVPKPLSVMPWVWGGASAGVVVAGSLFYLLKLRKQQPAPRRRRR